MNLLKRIINSIKNSILSFADNLLKKSDDIWVFPVYFIGEGSFIDNSLAVFEKVKNNHNIKKIILKKEKDIYVEGKNVLVVPMNSWKAVWYLLRANIIFVQHSIWLDYKNSRFQIIDPKNRHIINLWHGIPIKDISHANTGIINDRFLKEMPRYKVICSSEVDKKNMQKAFFDTPKENFWITGLPRNDFLVMEQGNLPKIYREELKKLDDLLSGKKLFLYAPTYRETNIGGKYYEFDEKEIEQLEKILNDNNAILGLRYHFYRRPSFVEKLYKRELFLDLSETTISDVRMIIRKSSLVITDYSSLYVDALYINKKCISYAYDYEHYLKNQRGFFYDFQKIFPGEICHDFDSLINAVENWNTPMNKEKIDKIKNILFKYLDANNSERVVAKVKELN